MISKAWFMFLLIVLSLLMVSVVFAGDVPESIVSNPTTEVGLGTIESIGPEKITIKVAEYLFETLNKPVIEVPNFNYPVKNYSFSRPKVGDSCIVTIKAIGDDIDIYYDYGFCAKTDSLDKSTLKLDTSVAYMQELNTYINNGIYSKKYREEILSNLNQNKTTESKMSEPLISSTFIVIGIICCAAIIIAFISKAVFKR